MVYYCLEVWGGREIRRGIFWPVYGTFEDWVCQALYIYANDKQRFDKEESEYGYTWLSDQVLFRVFTLKGEQKKRTRKGED